MRNKIALILKMIAWFIFAFGFFAGFGWGMVEVPYYTPNGSGASSEELSWLIVIVTWGIAFISGMIVWGLSEMIELLHRLVHVFNKE